MTSVAIRITSADHENGGFSWYEIYGSETNYALGSVVASAEWNDLGFQTTFIHANLTPGDTWYYWARAVYGRGGEFGDLASLGNLTIQGAEDDIEAIVAAALAARPAFLAYASASQLDVTGDGTDYTVSFATERYDVTGSFISTTFTAPVAGKYAFKVGLDLLAIAGTHNSIEVAFVCSTAGRVDVLYTNASVRDFAGEYIATGSADIDLALGETVLVKVNVAGTGKVVDVNPTRHTFFSGFLIQ